ncbi:MAG TPA: TIR domain-containing protein [Pyrinomonadaceae bacterium]|jgi:hypothetical protein
MLNTSTPKVFISYSWDSRKHKDWVRILSERLVLGGLDVLLDQWHVKGGDSFTQFMEKSVANSDFVVVVLTPSYARKSNERKGGVGYEQQIVSGQIMAGIPRSKFIPIVRSGRYEDGPKCAIPTHFAGIAAIDFRRDKEFDEKLEELLRTIHSKPQFAPPAIGTPPDFVTIRDTLAVLSNDRAEGARQTEAHNLRREVRGSISWGELQPLYFESFDAADANIDDPAVLRQKFPPLWLPYREDIWLSTITGGAYMLINSVDPKAVRYKYLRINDEDMSEAPVSVEVKVKLSKKDFLSGAGLIYRFDRESKNYYVFMLSGENKFAFYLRSNGVYTPLYSGRSNVIQPDQFNKIAINSSGTSFDLYINDSFIKAIKDSGLMKGDVGIIAMGKGEFSFDNLAIYELT